MEGTGLSGRIFSNVGGGILGLEMPLHPSQTNQNTSQNHPQMMPFNHHQQPQPQPQQDQQTQLTMKQPSYPYGNPNPNPPPKNKTQMTQSTNSDEDEPGNDDGSFDGKRKSVSSPWQRMKWTDSMVRLLIMAVYYIGDEAGSDHGTDKKKPGVPGGSSGGVLQKKGKWKSVSRAMMEKGFYVSPQQCEDKFNDLNKRYKRVNDILGKGTACNVVENQSLLDTMDLSPKLKEEVRKLLNSKHLFFKEMCAYHRSCGHDTGVSTASPTVPEASHHHHHQQSNPQQQQPQSCLHSSGSTAPIPPPSSMVPSNPKSDDHDDDDDNNDDDDDDDDDDEYEDEEEAEDEEQEEGGARKRTRTMGGISSNTSQALEQLNGEIMGMLQDGTKSSWEKKYWVLTQLIQFEEKGVKFQTQAVELEKERQKWLKFSIKKDREMEKMKLDNEKSRLENEKMVLFLRKKEIELLSIEQRSSANPSCVTG